MQRIQFELGEDRHIRLLVHATNEEPFAIREASFELRWAGEVEAAGVCVIDDHIIDAKISPSRRATYQLLITYKVADETLKERIEVVVE